MFSDSIELMFSSERAESVTHHPPTGEDNSTNGIFEEVITAETEQQDGRTGLNRYREATLVIPAAVAVVIGKKRSEFIVRGEIWTVRSATPGRGVQTVRLSRGERSTESKPVTRSYPAG